MKYLYLFPTCFLFSLLGCSGPAEETLDLDEWSYLMDEIPLSTVKEDTLTVGFDLTKPVNIQFGRGNANGLNTVDFSSNGNVTLCQVSMRGGTNWQETKFILTKEEVSKVLDAMRVNRLLSLHREYHAAALDGTQWILRVKQENKARSVYFDNYFPKSIIEFAKQLDDILSKSRTRKVMWKQIDKDDAFGRQRELWMEINKR